MAREIKVQLKLAEGSADNIKNQINNIKGKATVGLELKTGEWDKIGKSIRNIKANVQVGLKLSTNKTAFKTQIADMVGKKGLSVKVKLETEGQKLSADKLSKQIGTLKISKIDASGAIKGVKAQLQTMMNALTITPAGKANGLAAFLGADTISSIAGKTGKAASNEMAKIAAEARKAEEATAKFQGRMNSLNTTADSVASSFKAAEKTLGAGEKLDDFTKRYSDLEERRSLLSKAGSGDPDEILKMQSAYQALQTEMKETVALQKQEEKAAKAAAAANKQNAASIKEMSTLNRQMQQTLSRNSKLRGTEYEKQMKSMMSTLDSGNLSKDTFAEYQTRYQNILKEASAAGKMGQTFGSRIKTTYERLLAYGAITGVFYQITAAARSLYTNVVNIDTAMTQLRKVTDETNSTYDKFFDGVSDRAKSIGATMSDTINASADFARLGYDIDTASKMADAALVYKNVGDNITDISQASQSLTSTIQAFKDFGIEATDAMQVVDKFNEVGNNFAISSDGIGEALQRSASAMAAGNNNLDETIGLITAANTIAQDPKKVGTTLKTVSMYLRSSKTELEDAGESTDGMVESVSKLRGELLALTGGKVDIIDMNGAYKSTYEIFRELSEVWDSLSDLTQANILEKIGGKLLPLRTAMCA